MENDQIVPDEGAEATIPVEGEIPPKSQVEEEKPLTKAEILRMLDEKEKHWQSVSERQRKSLSSEAKNYRKRAESAESQLTAFNEMAVRDPRVAAQMRAAQTTAKARAFEEQSAKEQQEQNTREFYSILEESIVDDGLDPQDERIDWGMDAPDPIQAMRRFNTSVSKIKKENAKSQTEKRDQDVKDVEMRLRKELGMDSAGDTTSAGAGGKRIFTTAQIADRTFWEEHKAEILKAQEEGRIVD